MGAFALETEITLDPAGAADQHMVGAGKAAGRQESFDDLQYA